MVEIAKGESLLWASPDDFYWAPWRLNCPNGTVDLRTGELHPHRRDDPVDAHSRAPGTSPTLPAVVGGVPRTSPAGPMVVARGCNGSPGTSSLAPSAKRSSSSIGAVVPTGSRSSGRRWPPCSAATPSRCPFRHSSSAPATMVSGTIWPGWQAVDWCSRSSRATASRWRSPAPQQLTGGDRIAARRLYQEFFDFTPQCVPVMSSNYKPVVQGMDGGLWRRLRLIPWTVSRSRRAIEIQPSA